MKENLLQILPKQGQNKKNAETDREIKYHKSKKMISLQA